MKRGFWWRWGVSLLWVVAIALGWGGWGDCPAIATLYQHEDVPGQILFRAQARVQDADRHAWQVLVFTHRRAGQRVDALRLRIVGFPGWIALDHTQALTLETVLGQKFILPNVSDELAQPAPDNVAQFELETVLPQLENTPVRLWIPSKLRDPVVLKIRPALVQEWQNLLQ